MKSLSPQETLLQSYEDTDRRLEQYRLSDHDDLQNFDKRSGHMMFSNEFILRVQKVTRNRIWAEVSYRDPNVLGFYYSKNNEKTYICSFDKGVLPEFSIIVPDAADLPVKERRGWRTVLTRLVQVGAMTWPEVVHAFGDTSTAASDRWRFNTREFRSK